MSDARKNFAYSLVATAPSPASSGTSLVVTAGEGALFPSPAGANYNLVICPAGTQPISTNAEIVRVTALSTDTFTIVRTQESTSARTILVGDQVFLSITKKTLDDIDTDITTHTHTSVSGNAGTVTVADAGSDATTWVLLGTSQTGSLSPATDAGLTYNASTDALTATTFIGALTGTASGNLVSGGALGTPSSGTVTNLTGTASININGTVGATTPTTITATTITVNTALISDGDGGAALGVAGTGSFSSLQLATNGVINFGNGAATITNTSADVLTIDGADLKISSPGNASTSVLTTDGTQTLTAKTLTSPTITSPTIQGSYDGWISANESWTYASASTITVPAGATSKYRKGDFIKWTQTTVKYGIIVTVADTLLTIVVNTDYVVTNAAISANYYSHQGNPIGFPGTFNWTPTITYISGTTDPTSNTINYARFNLVENVVFFKIRSTIVRGGGDRVYTLYSLPITRANNDYFIFPSICNWNSTQQTLSGYSDRTAEVVMFCVMNQNGSACIEGFYHI